MIQQTMEKRIIIKFYSVYNYDKKPIVISLMGNHDYIDSKYNNTQNQLKFFKYMKSYPYSHYIINNFNFIFWSNDNYNIDKDFTWIESTLEKEKIIKIKKEIQFL